MSGSDDSNNASGGKILRFPQSRVAPAGSGHPVKNLGFGPMARIVGAAQEQVTGHWCSRCQGIWHGYLLEVACPVCGNRRG